MEMSHLHVRLERPIRLLEVIEGLGLGREALLDDDELLVILNEALVLGVRLGADGHLGVLEQTDWAHIRKLSHLVLGQELTRSHGAP